MHSKSRLKNGFITVFLITAFFIGTLPLKAQDIVTSSDISGGSSVFVFRGNRKAKQTKVAYQAVAKRTVVQKRETRVKLVKQSTTIAKAAQKARPTKRVDAAEFAKIQPQIARMSKDQASLVFAGAGEYYLERDDVDKSLEFFRESLELNETNKAGKLGLSDADVRKGNQLLEKEMFAQSKFYFEDAIKNDPNNATAYAGLAEAQDSTDETDKAVENYEKAVSLNQNLTELYTPLGISYYRKGDIAKAKSLLTKALASDADNPETQFFLATILYKENKNQEALTAIQKVLKSDANNADAHYLMANILDSLGKSSEAIAEYNQTVTINPKSSEAFFDLGAAQFNAGNYAESIKAYETVTRFNNTNWEAYLNLADAYWQAGEFTKAESAYNLALTFLDRNKTADVSNEEKAEIYSKFGFTIGQVCQNLMAQRKQCNKWLSMLNNFQKAVDLAPDAINYSNLGWAYFNQGHLDMVSKRETEGREKLLKAKAALESAINLKPKFVEAPLMNLGGTYIDLGDYQAAIDTLKQVTGKRGDWQTADYMMGVAYRKKGDLDKAADAFNSAIKKDDKYIAALAGLGETQFRRNKKDEANKVVARLKSIGTPDAIAQAQKLEAVMRLPS